MNLDIFQALPDESRLWVYGFKTSLNGKERKVLEARLSSFLPHWETHGTRVEGSFLHL